MFQNDITLTAAVLNNASAETINICIHSRNTSTFQRAHRARAYTTTPQAILKTHLTELNCASQLFLVHRYTRTHTRTQRSSCCYYCCTHTRIQPFPRTSSRYTLYPDEIKKERLSLARLALSFAVALEIFANKQINCASHALVLSDALSADLTYESFSTRDLQPNVRISRACSLARVNFS